MVLLSIHVRASVPALQLTARPGLDSTPTLSRTLPKDTLGYIDYTGNALADSRRQQRMLLAR